MAGKVVIGVAAMLANQRSVPRHCAVMCLGHRPPLIRRLAKARSRKFDGCTYRVPADIQRFRSKLVKH